MIKEAPIENEEEELQRQQIEKTEEALLLAQDLGQLNLGEDNNEDKEAGDQPGEAMEVDPPKKPEKPRKQASILSFFKKKIIK